MRHALAALTAAAVFASAADELKITADRIAADRQTGAFVATGHVRAVSAPVCLLSELVERDEEGVYTFSDPTALTTCTNDERHLHWKIRGGVEYRGSRYIELRNVWLEAWNVPVFWLPYWYYPLDTEYGFRAMPGYTSRWGVTIQTKYVYRLFGDFKPGEFGASAATRFDLRYENGIAFGQDLTWQLGDFGRGAFKLYYAWDEDADRYERRWDSRRWNYRNWQSTVPDDRYGMNFTHRWEATERDVARVRAGYFTDSRFKRDFLQKSVFGMKNEFLGAERNEAAWEHRENAWSAGVGASGSLNDFYGGTARLPEAYVDIAPQPVLDTSVDYESQTRLGYLVRDYARYGDGETALPFRYNPGRWADCRTFRFDTYHRLTLPFKVADTVSVVPRIAYRGTFWGEDGYDGLDGLERAGKAGDDPWRLTVEGGVTFAARGTALVADGLRHVIEPYLDVLAQDVEYHGLGDGRRPYVFDSIDASSDWLDQFAGRSRNLPYSWYGLTPGLRNVLRRADADGVYRTILDADAYVALQCNHAHFTEGDRYHRLSDDPADPNYGNSFEAVPGLRLRWMPDADVMLSARGEYDAEHNTFAYAAVTFTHRLSKDFRYNVGYIGRDHRYWDFSSSPYDPDEMRGEDFNWLEYRFLGLGFEHEICDAVAWGPFLHWDCRENELDEAGTWIDFRTDCLGFRFSVSYDNDYRRLDGSLHDDDWRFGFYIYLRALGPSTGSPFGD